MSKGRVFVVEDDQVMMSFIQELLISENYQIVGSSETGEDAILSVIQLNPDIILMDIELAGYLDGVEAAERIRDSYLCPIIFMSGLSDNETVKRTMNNEAYAYLIKPFKARELIITLELTLFKYNSERAIKQKQQTLSQTLKYLGEGLIVADRNLIIQMVNPITSKLLQQEEKELLGLPLNSVLKIEDMSTNQLILAIIDLKKWPFPPKQVYETNTIMVNALGEKIPIYININCFYNSDDELEGFIIVFRDLSLHLKNQQQIERLSQAIHFNPIGIMILDPQGVIEYINPKFTEISGYTESDLLQHSISSLLNEVKDRQKFEIILDHIKNEEEWKTNYHSHRKDGSQYWENIILTPIRNEKHEVISYVLIKEDITSSKTAIEMMEQSEKKYRDLFENSPVALWYVNFIKVHKYLNQLKGIGIEDLNEYFDLNHDYFIDCIKKIEIVDVNKRALDLIICDNKDDILSKFMEVFSLRDYLFFRDLFDAIYHEHYYQQNDIQIKTMDHHLKIVQINWLASGSNEDALNNVLISTNDITEKVMTNEALKKQTMDLKERMKEQNTLYRILTILNNKDLSFATTIDTVCKEIPKAFLHHEHTYAKIDIIGQSYQSDQLMISRLVYSKEIVLHEEQLGEVSIYCDIPQSEFLIYNEEKELINNVASQIAQFVEVRRKEDLIQSKLEFESLISKISSRFLSMENFENNVQESLQDIGINTQSDRSYIFIYKNDYQYMDNVYEWCNRAEISQIQYLQDISTKDFPWWQQKILSGEAIKIKKVSQMPEEAVNEKEILLEQSIDSIIVLPLFVEERVIGYVGFDYLSEEKSWNENDFLILKLFTQILSNAWERKLTSEQLLSEHNFTNQIIDSVSSLIIVIDTHRNVLKFNDYCQKLSGFKGSEIKTIDDLKKLSLPEEFDDVKLYYSLLLDGVPQDTLEIMWRTKDKKIRIIQWKSSIVYEGDNVDYLILNGTDITEIRRAENLLIDKEQQYRSLVENLTVGVFRSTGLNSGRLLQANQALANMLGYESIDELMKVNENEFYSNSSDRTELIKEAIKFGKISKKEMLFKHKEGYLIWGLINATTIFDDYGNFKWIDGFIEDITEKRQLENQLLQSQKMEAIGQLAAGIAHEINTPTQFVSDNLNFLKDSFETMQKMLNKIDTQNSALACDELKNNIESLKTEADFDFISSEIPLAIQQSLDGLDRVTRIVRAMKDFSHPGTEDQKSMSINAMLESTITVARNEWKYHCEMHTHYGENLPNILCFPGELNQAFLNIIVNASQAIKEKIKDSSERGVITIETLQEGSFIEIRISDTGVGISQEIKDKLYNPFFTTKEPGKGTGQGLSIVHHSIVNKHNGTIDFVSEVGKGTTFIIRLPL